MSNQTCRRLAGQHSERGAITPMVVVVVLALLLMVGLVVDAGAKLNAVSQANDVAAQAAHAAAAELDAAGTLATGVVAIDDTQAQAAGMAVIAAAGMTGSVSIDDASVTVTTTCIKPTSFVSIIGINTVQGTGTAQVRLATEG